MSSSIRSDRRRSLPPYSGSGCDGRGTGAILMLLRRARTGPFERPNAVQIMCRIEGRIAGYLVVRMRACTAAGHAFKTSPNAVFRDVTHVPHREATTALDTKAEGGQAPDVREACASRPNQLTRIVYDLRDGSRWCRVVGTDGIKGRDCCVSLCDELEGGH